MNGAKSDGGRGEIPTPSSYQVPLSQSQLQLQGGSGIVVSGMEMLVVNFAGPSADDIKNTRCDVKRLAM
ncbi:hypothetical protein GN244_ATG09111 [Phytophthora infestans]|uniref:Uncharacterized protein n=1 Tax=Phytophthora infestans TaxID=4787 RepID=A0A833SBM1_PHYIN|nr:hypothetical protein GN244_ATG09111 [Phytophthora infestans]